MRLGWVSLGAASTQIHNWDKSDEKRMHEDTLD